MAAGTTAPPVFAPPSHHSIRGLTVIAALVLGASLYASVFAGLVRQWYNDPNAAYGPLVVLAALVAARQRWPRLRSLPVQGCYLAAIPLLSAAALYGAATLAADVFALRVSFVLFFAASIWFVCGTAHVRVLAAPLLLCAVALPPPSALVTELTMPLQLAASRIAASTLDIIGLDVVRDGNILTLNHITLEVAEACSGMRSIVTLGALVAVFWGTSAPPLSRVLVLAAATVPVALAGNAMRVVATALLALRIGDGAVRGTVHDATGLIAFIVMGAALAGIYVASGLLGETSAGSGSTPGKPRRGGATVEEAAA